MNYSHCINFSLFIMILLEAQGTSLSFELIIIKTLHGILLITLHIYPEQMHLFLYLSSSCIILSNIYRVHPIDGLELVILIAKYLILVFLFLSNYKNNSKDEAFKDFLR